MTPHEPSRPWRKAIRAERRGLTSRRTRNAPPPPDLEVLTQSLIGSTADMLAEAQRHRQPKEGS